MTEPTKIIIRGIFNIIKKLLRSFGILKKTEKDGSKEI